MPTNREKRFAKASSTPHSNTGSPRQSTPDTGVRGHLDYLVVCGCGDILELERAVWSVFGTNFDWNGAKGGMRGHYYEMILKSAQSIELAINPLPDSPSHGNFRLSIPGQPLQHVHFHELLKLVGYLSRNRYNCTRFDWAVDDFDHSLSMDELADACERGDYSGANSHRYFQRKKRGHYEIGRTIYLGSSQSDKQIRIYDKNIESKGQVNSIRYEIQWRGILAAAAFKALSEVSATEEGCKKISMLALGGCHFYEKRNQVLSRSKSLANWEEFVRKVGGSVKLSARRVQPLISDKIRWVESQVVRTLALISQVKGFDDTINWLERRMREAAGKMPSSGIMYVKSWFDRISVEKGKFEDWMVISDWERV